MSSFGANALPNGGGGRLGKVASGLAVLAYQHRMHRSGGGGGGMSIHEMITQGQLAYELNDQTHNHTMAQQGGTQLDIEKTKAAGPVLLEQTKGEQLRKTSTHLNRLQKNSNGFHLNGVQENDLNLSDTNDAVDKSVGLAERLNDAPPAPTPGTPQGFTPQDYSSQGRASAPGPKRTPKSKQPKPPIQGTLF